MSIKFLPTPEQKEISTHFISAITFEDNDFLIPVEAPAGTGKTQLTAGFMKDLQDISPEKRVGYFIFNSFMKDEINKRAYAMDIHNTSFFTYHSFLLDHALKNERMKQHFIDSNNELRIDFNKQGYSKDESMRSSSYVLGGQEADLMSDFLRTAFNEWLNSDELLMDFSVNLIKTIYEVEEEYSELPEPYQRVQLLMDDFETYLAKGREKILSRVKGDMTSDLPLDKVAMLFLVQGMKHMLQANKLSHSAYYKEVYNIALKENINLFEDFDAIIVDEAQDMDKVFKRLVELANKPTMVIGDRSQSIYSWRGAVNMMEEAGKKNDVYSLSYSFRYDNDVAQLSNLLLMEKDEDPAVFVTGKYTDKINNIEDDTCTALEMSQTVMDTISKRLFLCERFEGLPPQEMDTKELIKFLAQEKVAFISRNNSTLIDALFQALPYIRSFEQSEHVHISLTDTVNDDFSKIQKCDFGTRTNKRIGELAGVPYAVFKKDKTLSEMLQMREVREALFENKKLNFLLEAEKYDNFKFLMRQLSPRMEDYIKVINCDFGNKINKDISKAVGMPYKDFKKGKTLDEMLGDEVVISVIAENKKMNFLLDAEKLKLFHEITRHSTPKGENFVSANYCDFGTQVNRRIVELTSIPYREYKRDKNLDEMLRDEVVRSALAESDEFNFLLDNEKLEFFKFLMDQLPPKSNDSISKNDEQANFIFTTVHGSKGKEYKYTFVASDILQPDNDGVIEQEEYNIAYVALTRTKGKLYFMNNTNGQPHPLHNFYRENKEKLSAILESDYTLTFPYGVDLTISKSKTRNDTGLYTHTFRDKDGDISLFLINEPIKMGMVGYLGEESTRGIKFRGIENKEKMLSFDGEEKHINSRDNITHFHYGVGKTKNLDTLIKKKDLIQQRVEVASPKR